VDPTKNFRNYSVIEQVWRAIKREVAATFITDREHLMATITEAFKKLVAKRSYWKKWVLKFLSPKYASKLLGGDYTLLRKAAMRFFMPSS